MNTITYAGLRRSIRIVLLCGLMAVAIPIAHAITPEQAVAAESAKQDAEASGANDEAVLQKYFGAGIVADIDLGGKSHKRVKSASTVGGVVRINEESTSRVGFFLEAHKFISSTQKDGSRIVYGPFVGIVMADNAIDTGILGVMAGFRQPFTTQTLNVGVGVSISPNAQVLGDGIVADQALPAGETQVRYKKVTKYGLAVTVSFGF